MGPQAAQDTCWHSHVYGSDFGGRGETKLNLRAGNKHVKAKGFEDNCAYAFLMFKWSLIGLLPGSVLAITHVIQEYKT